MGWNPKQGQRKTSPQRERSVKNSPAVPKQRSLLRALTRAMSLSSSPIEAQFARGISKCSLAKKAAALCFPLRNGQMSTKPKFVTTRKSEGREANSFFRAASPPRSSSSSSPSPPPCGSSAPSPSGFSRARFLPPVLTLILDRAERGQSRDCWHSSEVFKTKKGSPCCCYHTMGRSCKPLQGIP